MDFRHLFHLVLVHQVFSDIGSDDPLRCPARCDILKEVDTVRMEITALRQLLNQESLVRMNMEDKLQSQQLLIEVMAKEINFVNRTGEKIISETRILQSEVQQMNANFSQSESNQITGKPRTIAFTVSTSSHLRYKKNKKIIYDKVITNEGAAYNTTTGIFTCPSTGTYVFTWSTMSRSDTEPCSANIINNGIKLLQSYSTEDNGGGNEVASNTVTLSLTTGDHVWVKTENGEFCAGYPFTAFSGWKI